MPFADPDPDPGLKCAFNSKFLGNFFSLTHIAVFLRTFFLNLTFKKAFYEKKRHKRHFVNKKHILSSKFMCNFYIWVRIRIRILNTDPDPDPATQINADPDPQPCL